MTGHYLIQNKMPGSTKRACFRKAQKFERSNLNFALRQSAAILYTCILFYALEASKQSNFIYRKWNSGQLTQKFMIEAEINIKAILYWEAKRDNYGLKRNNATKIKKISQ